MGKKDKGNPLKGEETATTIKKKRQLVDAPSGDQFNYEEHLGQLVIIEPLEYDEIKTTASTDLAPIIKANVTVLTKKDGVKPLKEVEEYTNTMLFGKVITSALKGIAGKDQLVVGVIGQGEKQPGKNPAWIIVKATDEQRAIAEASL
jgi:hypothetical protein